MVMSVAKSAVGFDPPLEWNIAFRANKFLLLEITAAIEARPTSDYPHSLVTTPANWMADSKHFYFQP
jgi:hypothetical protein